MGRVAEEIAVVGGDRETMYSIVRFTLPKDRAHELIPIGERMNGREPNVFSGLRRAKDGFACEICSTDRLEDHLQDVEDFLCVHRASVDEAVALGATVTFDIALGGNDKPASAPYLSLPFQPEFLRLLAEAKARLEITLYAGRDYD
jgi:hypothetical protein